MADGDIEIARRYKLRPIDTVAAKLGLESQHLLHYGPYKAKVPLDVIGSLPERPGAKLVLVTAMTPTPAGEGKSTTTVGLGDALNHIGKQAVICLREPSLGPCFGIKGGATGGGQSQVVPMEDINLHFTGDFHAITTANNLLAALIDNHVYWGNELDIDVRRINWRRVLDMNDRALRSVVSSLGGAGNGFPREDGFDITVASEVMAIFCLAKDLDDLKQRLGNIIFARARGREHRPLRASQLKAEGAMTALLKDALMPNLVQTMEGNPAFVHGGPFANIAHGCNSVMRGPGAAPRHRTDRVRAGCCRARRGRSGAPASASARIRRRVSDGLDDLVDHADLQRPVDPAGDLLVLGGELRVQRLALPGRRRGQLLAVQDADRGLTRP